MMNMIRTNFINKVHPAFYKNALIWNKDMKTKIGFIGFLVSFLLASCGLTQPLSKCDIKDMLLNEADFPQGTIINDLSSPVAEYPAESASFTASFMNNSIYHVVGKYSSDNRAERKFTERFDLYFKKDGFEGPWQTPTELSYISPFAQKYHVACGNILEEYQCRMIGQYDEYYVFFFAYISDNGITLDTFQDLLPKIDSHMAQCLQN